MLIYANNYSILCLKLVVCEVACISLTSHEEINVSLLIISRKLGDTGPFVV